MLIFAQRKQDVDAIHEYLLLKGVETVAIHGGKGRRIETGGVFFSLDNHSDCLDQEERFYALEKFVKGEKDVLCATDVASKGLDFPDIQHVINYDLPEDIENYGKLSRSFSLHFHFSCSVHRIGRTGRRGLRGLATTFINKTCGKFTLAILFTAIDQIPS